jgi:hypothetical protein
LTAQGHPRAIYQRAIERDNLLVAETTLREQVMSIPSRTKPVVVQEVAAALAELPPRVEARPTAITSTAARPHRRGILCITDLPLFGLASATPENGFARCTRPQAKIEREEQG